jgi:phospholipid/cholesterol/gamma-HCH transport system substrate-binding protein
MTEISGPTMTGRMRASAHNPWFGRLVALAVVIFVLATGAMFVFRSQRPPTTVTAHFSSAVGIYTGSDVRILGVKVGEITAVEPEGKTVRIELAFDRKYKVPGDAVAVIVPPSVVSDRYVQLAPAYTSGPVLGDGADLPLARTATPVELDDIYRSLNDLNTALGPDGANADGSLSKLLKVGRENLDGQGESLNSTIKDLSTAARTLSEGRDDLFGTVRNLQQFTTALASSDAQVRKFNDNLASVSEQLDAEKEELAAAIRNLSLALAQVAAFVKENRQALTSNVAALGEVSAILVRQKEALTAFLDVAPTALSNLNLSYNPSAGTLDTRNNFSATQDLPIFVCSALARLPVQQIPQQCFTLVDLLAKNGIAMPEALKPLLKLLPIRLLPGANGPSPNDPPGSPSQGAKPTTPAAPQLPSVLAPLDKTLGGILKGVS